MECPSCEEQSLDSVHTVSGDIHRCPACGYLFVPLAMLEGFSPDPARFKETLREAQSFLIATGRTCPVCKALMQQGRVPTSGAILTLCTPCRALWVEPWQLYDLDQVVARALQGQLENPSAKPEKPKAPAPAPIQTAPPPATVSPDLNLPPPIPANPAPVPETTAAEPPPQPEVKPSTPVVPTESKALAPRPANVPPKRKDIDLPPIPTSFPAPRTPILWPKVPLDDFSHPGQIKPPEPPLAPAGPPVTPPPIKKEETPKPLPPPVEPIELPPLPEPPKVPIPAAEPVNVLPEIIIEPLPIPPAPADVPVPHVSVPTPPPLPATPTASPAHADSKVGKLLRSMAETLHQWADAMASAKTKKAARPLADKKPAAKPISKPDAKPAAKPEIKPFKPVQEKPSPKPVSAPEPKREPKAVPAPEPKLKPVAAGKKKSSVWTDFVVLMNDLWGPILKGKALGKPAAVRPAPVEKVVVTPPIEIIPRETSQPQPPPVISKPVVDMRPAEPPRPAEKKAGFLSGIGKAFRDAWSPPAMRRGSPEGSPAPLQKKAPAPDAGSAAEPSPKQPPTPESVKNKAESPVTKPTSTPREKRKTSWGASAAVWMPRIVPVLMYLLIGLTEEEWGTALIVAMTFWSLSQLFRLWWQVGARNFKETTIQQLEALPDPLQRRETAVVLTGRMITEVPKGVLKFTDDTGEILLNRLGPLDLLPHILGLTAGGQYPKEGCTIVGWYRRKKVPFIEVVEVRGGKRPGKSLVNGARWILASGVFVLSVLLFFAE